MAVTGNGREYDITLNAGGALRTTTSQYMVVGMVGATTTTDRLAELCDGSNTYGSATATSYSAIGVNQSYMSANSEICSVRMFGVSKVKCAASVAAGDWLVAYAGISTTTFPGYVVTLANGASIGCATASISSQYVILGRALEKGSTNTVISAFINPYMVERSTLNV